MITNDKWLIEKSQQTTVGKWTIFFKSKLTSLTFFIELPLLHPNYCIIPIKLI